MTPPEFSVLLLAWDDADPHVAVLGGSALPPTLPLVYQLAAHHPVLAVYPHLPPTDADAPTPAATPLAVSTPAAPPAKAAAAEAAAATAPKEPAGALDTAVAMPGVRLLPGAAVAAPQLLSRLVGLHDLAPAGPAQRQAVLLPAIVLHRPALASARSQWPTGENAPPVAALWLAPAAPYAGAAGAASFPPPPPAPPRAAAPAGAPLAAQKLLVPLATVPPAIMKVLRPNGRPQAGDLRFDPDPDLPTIRHSEASDEPIAFTEPAAFDELTEEVGTAEASDLSAPEDDLLPDAPAPAPEAPAVPAPAPAAAVSAAGPPAPVLLRPAPEGLNFRMIQYARRAAQLVRERSDFGVIYAPNWPAWLAALEIRNSSGQPLVLYAASLAADLPDPAEHGWQLEMERMTMRRATLILVPDLAVCRRLQALYGTAIGEVRVVAAADEAAVQRVLAEVAIG